ncbi:MAG TPA: hypothetical protein VFM41_14555 [Gaiella sp.]|nr:hypothetical protein [Gaiella sp.]
MTSPVVRLYAAAAALAAFFLTWAGIAARPWAAPPQDTRVAAVGALEQRLQRDAALVRQIVDNRAALAHASASAAAPAPPVRVVTLPPVTTTRTS